MGEREREFLHTLSMSREEKGPIFSPHKQNIVTEAEIGSTKKRRRSQKDDVETFNSYEHRNKRRFSLPAKTCFW